MPEPILYFHSPNLPFGDFSNLSPHGVKMDGLWWPTAENYYQAQKFEDADYREKIRNTLDPMRAFELGKSRAYTLRPDWEQARDAIMAKVVRQKLETRSSVYKLFLSTGERTIVDESPEDYYWGCGKAGTGQNRFGQLLERLRAQLRAENSPADEQRRQQERSDASDSAFDFYFDAELNNPEHPRFGATLYPCPCCGYATLNKRNDFEICTLCWWEDMMQDDPHADEVWDLNGDYSLTEARANFRERLIMFLPSANPASHEVNSPEEWEMKREIVGLFEAIKGANELEALRLTRLAREKLHALTKRRWVRYDQESDQEQELAEP